MTSDSQSDKALVNFIFEAGQLKRVKRSGWWVVHVKDPESVADHSFRAAIIGYVIGVREGANAERTAMMCLLNDLHEARLNDLHKVGHRYIDFKKAEAVAFKEQTERLPEDLPHRLNTLFTEFHTESTAEGILARDADLLECAFQAKEYLEDGFSQCQDWLDNIKPKLKSETAKSLFNQLTHSASSDWWQGLKKSER